MTSGEDFDSRLERLDLSLFDAIESQSSEFDRRSLLACQRATRRLVPEGYRYLEIGSHLGGSLVPHLLDTRCSSIVSIDKRPPDQPDERGVRFSYHDNSTERMLDLLGDVAPTDKITTFDSESTEVDPVELGGPLQLCFIDGEHTDVAAEADFDLCLRALDARGAILFHDAAITYRAIASCLERVRHREPVAYVLPDMVFVIEFGGFALHDDPYVREVLLHNHRAYLYGLQFNDPFRQFATRPVFRNLRSIRARMRRGH